jgi:outer membrane lipoprotein-sorting protein
MSRRLSPLPPLLIVAALTAGCATRALPGIEGPPASAALRTALRSALADREAAARSLRGTATITVSARGQQRRFREAFALEAGGRLRLEQYEWTGLATMILASDGEAVAAHLPFARQFLRGRATPENLARLVGLPVAPGVLTRLLLGLPPLRVDPVGATVLGAPGGPAVAVISERDGTAQALRFTPDTFFLQEGELSEGGQPLLRFRFGPAELLDGVPVARGLTLWHLPGGVEVTVAFDALELNARLDADLFSLAVPADAGVRIEDLDRPDRP